MRRVVPVLAFAGVLLLIPVQVVISRTIGEPYPALFQPSFGGTPLVDGVIHRTLPLVSIVGEGGDAIEVPFQEVLPSTRLQPLAVFTSAFGTQDSADRVASSDWLRTTIRDRWPGRAIDTLRVQWVDYELDPQTGREISSHVKSTVTLNGLSS